MESLPSWLWIMKTSRRMPNPLCTDNVLWVTADQAGVTSFVRGVRVASHVRHYRDGIVDTHPVVELALESVMRMHVGGGVLMPYVCCVDDDELLLSVEDEYPATPVVVSEMRAPRPSLWRLDYLWFYRSSFMHPYPDLRRHEAVLREEPEAVSLVEGLIMGAVPPDNRLTLTRMKRSNTTCHGSDS